MTTFFYIMAWLAISNAVAACVNGFYGYYKDNGEMGVHAHRASMRMLLSMMVAALFFMVAK